MTNHIEIVKIIETFRKSHEEILSSPRTIINDRQDARLAFEQAVAFMYSDTILKLERLRDTPIATPEVPETS